MYSNSKKDRGRLRGYIWECVVVRLLANNGFQEITTFDGEKIRQSRPYFTELRGRGGWHQIDCPCDYVNFVPFINPIRLLSEVKFHSQQIDKRYIREFIAVVKDISENYFVDDYSTPSSRNTELGVFFSATGFDDEAERLAFAHNIKTISYHNVEIMFELMSVVKELEANYLDAGICLSSGRLNNFMSQIRSILSSNAPDYGVFSEMFSPSEGFERVLNSLRDAFLSIRSSFIATSTAGVTLHFVSRETFPEDLFRGTDEQLCRVHREGRGHRSRFYLKFVSDQRPDAKFYFSPPMAIKAAAFSARKLLDEKGRIFNLVFVARKIDGLDRNLRLKLDRDWIDTLTRAVRD